MVEGENNLRRALQESPTPAPTFTPLDPVKLLDAGKFAILTKTGVSATVGTEVTGDVGSSPVAATYITGFGLIADSTNEFSTSSLVNAPGKLYAANYAVPTPAKMTTAISNMEAAYTDAAGRVGPDYTEEWTGALGGETLEQGLYKWGTGVDITNSLVFDGPANAVWILQVAGDVTIGNSAQMTLSGGAQASNIFWQVSGQTLFGTTSQNKGVFLCQTEIVFQTGSRLIGAALAQTAVTLDAATILKESVCDTTVGCQL